MFKVIALIGAVAGGATYGYYQYGYEGCDGGTCPLSRKSCCADAPQPAGDCCASHDACCDDKVASAKASCCAESATCPTGFFTSAKTSKAAPCCANPCAACADGCDWCPICEIDCSGCCGLTANAAVAGPAAAIVASKPKK